MEYKNTGKEKIKEGDAVCFHKGGIKKANDNEWKVHEHFKLRLQIGMFKRFYLNVTDGA